MSTPPRRRRSEPGRSSSGGSGWIPTLALGLGVIVAGLGIGALIAVLMQRNQPPDRAVATVSAAPAAQSPASRPPIAIATLVPPRTPRPSPSPAESPSPAVSPSPAESPSPVKSASPTVSPSPARAFVAPPAPRVTSTTATQAAPAVSPAPAAVAEATATPAAEEAPGASATSASAQTPATAAPAQAATAATTGPAAAMAPVAPASGVPSAYDEHASGVVRGYIDALIRGDQKSAYHALGETAAASGGVLTEQSFLDPNARIVSLKVTRIDASNATVGCEIAAAKGRFYATYHVTAGSNGPYISEHDYIKV